MASTIAAITTGIGGIVTTADATGNLSLLSGTSTVVAVTSAGAAVTGTMSVSGATTLTGGLNTPLAVTSGGTGVATSTGSGANVLGTSPTLTTPTISTITSAAATALTLQSASTTAVTIDTSQNVGIGGAPAYKLDITSSAFIGSRLAAATGTNGVSQIYTNTGGAFSIGIDASTGANFGAAYGGFLWHAGAYPLLFGTSNAERMRIDSSGDVIIGGTTATATARLNVYQADSSQRVVHFENTRNISSDENLRLVLGTNCNNTASYQFIVTTAGADKLYIYGNGNIVNTNNSYGALSDTKLKENIVDATPKLADLMQVRVRNYNLIGDSTKQIGVVAQELETIFPAMVDESPDREQQPKTREVEVPAVKEVKDENGNITTEAVPATTRTEEYTEQVAIGTVTKSVKYSVFVPMLIKAIQEQQALIIQLQADVAALKGVKV